MKVPLVRDGYPLIIGLLLFFGIAGVIVQHLGWPRLAGVMGALGVTSCGFMIYFFRDPERLPPDDPDALVAGADGLVRSVDAVREDRYLKCDTLRISVFLSPFDVHVNRCPMAGVVRGLAYTPGRHLLTLRNAASEVNEHSSIYIEGEKTRCLVRQIVGPIVRRVVYWLVSGQILVKGERIGMMKFGSRLDIYFPKDDIAVLVKKGDRVRAGETVVARLARK